jgi:RNA polymerase-binding transcription factor DksA
MANNEKTHAAAQNDKHRACSWCGKSDTEALLVAAPYANICEACTRLACAIFGIEIVDKKSE